MANPNITGTGRDQPEGVPQKFLQCTCNFCDHVWRAFPFDGQMNAKWINPTNARLLRCPSCDEAQGTLNLSLEPSKLELSDGEMSEDDIPTTLQILGPGPDGN